MNEKMIHEMDEYFTTVTRTLPGGLRSFYSKLIEEGFREDQAIYFTTEWMRSMFPPMPFDMPSDMPDLPDLPDLPPDLPPG